MRCEGQQVQLDQKHGKKGSMRRSPGPEESGTKESTASTEQQTVHHSVNYDTYALSLEWSIPVLLNTRMLDSAASTFQLSLLPCSGGIAVQMEKKLFII